MRHQKEVVQGFGVSCQGARAFFLSNDTALQHQHQSQSSCIVQYRPLLHPHHHTVIVILGSSFWHEKMGTIDLNNCLHTSMILISDRFQPLLWKWLPGVLRFSHLPWVAKLETSAYLIEVLLPSLPPWGGGGWPVRYGFSPFSSFGPIYVFSKNPKKTHKRVNMYQLPVVHVYPMLAEIPQKTLNM